MTLSQTALPIKNYNLALTLASGQAFRWRRSGGAWEGVVGSRWVRLRQEPGCLRAETYGPAEDWRWLRHYLQTEVDLDPILAAFPDDSPMREAVAACRGLRLLRQEPWECLASFICSSTKQIVQIEQIVGLLSQKFGPPLPLPPGIQSAGAFPTVERLAAASEAELRACKLGFRAPYLSGTARKLAAGRLCSPCLAWAPKSPIACCSSLTDFRRPSRWMSGSSRRCNNFIFQSAARSCHVCGISAGVISGLTAATRSNTCFTTCERASGPPPHKSNFFSWQCPELGKTVSNLSIRFYLLQVAYNQLHAHQL
jgi:hypothetical protein